jgi:CheY-like chemotaxis protein
MDKQKILLVEDDNLTRNILLKMITSLGYDVDSSENGEAAISKIKEYEPDLIITDIVMPEYSGLQLLNFVQKKIIRNIPTLLISTMDVKVVEDLVNDIGAVGFISKPPTKEELKLKIELGLNS